MNAAEKDQFAHALGQTLGFYGKKLEDNDFGFWVHAMGIARWDEIRAALLEYTKRGKYAPKPVDIIELIKEQQNTRRLDKTLPAPKIDRTSRSEKIANAWLFWIDKWKLPIEFHQWPKVEGVSDEQAEEWLLLVNEESKRCGEPNAIPEAYKIAEIWDRPDARKAERQDGLDPDFCHHCLSLRITQRHQDMCQ